MNISAATGIDHAGAKLGAAWGGALFAKVGVTSWSDVAALLAALYTFCLLCEWWWKKFWRPFLERRGWLPPRKRRKSDCD